MDVPFDHETLAAAQREVVRENKLESCYLRPIIWVGSEKLGVSAKGNTIHVAIAAWPWGAYLGEDGMKGHSREDLVVHAPPRERLHGRAPRRRAGT